jgi:serine/threonine-protein phosphatase 2A regulatory subunit B
MKPAVMEDLTEVVTSAEFHPNHCNLFVYSSSRGTIRLADMRQRALCDKQAKSNAFLFFLTPFSF